jgi:hypothetical protein
MGEKEIMLTIGIIAGIVILVAVIVRALKK